MARKFTNENELVEEHHTQRIRTDTTTQSKNDIDLLTVINEAKQLIQDELLDKVKDKRILEIQNYLNEYSKELEKYQDDPLDINIENSSQNLSKNIQQDIQIQNTSSESKPDLEIVCNQNMTCLPLPESKESLKKKSVIRLCQSKDKVKWTDDIFQVPNPTNNKTYVRDIALGSSLVDLKLSSHASDELQIEKLTNEILNKYNFLDYHNANINTDSVPKIKKNKLKNDGIKILKSAEKIETTENNSIQTIGTEESYSGFVEISESDENNMKNTHASVNNIPELKITAQKVLQVIVEAKKISIENIETTQNFDSDFKIVEIKSKEIQTQETRIAEIKNVIAFNTVGHWRKFVKMKQERRKMEIEKKKQAQKIDSFVEKLEGFKKEISKQIEEQDVKQKPKSNTNTSVKQYKIKNFEYRFKAQKDIIEMQKKKLAEQNKIIEELKQNKLHEDTKESFQNAKTLLQKSFVQKQPRKIIKKQESKEVETQSEPDSLNLVLKLNSVPKNIKTMEDRAKERQEKRLIIQERKRVLDEEKKRLVEEAVQRKAKEEQEEKEQRVEKLKRQRDAVRQMELRKQQEKQRYIQLTETALQHYKNKLKKLGLGRLKSLVYNLKIKCEISKRFYEHNVILICFKSWHVYSSQIIKNKNKKALDLFSNKLLCRTWANWKSYQFQMIQMDQVALDRYEMSLQASCFNDWRTTVRDYRVQFIHYATKADKYYKRYVLFNCLEKWRSLPAIMRIERIQNERKRKWRLRVAEILSDYDPLKNYEL